LGKGTISKVNIDAEIKHFKDIGLKHIKSTKHSTMNEHKKIADEYFTEKEVLERLLGKEQVNTIVKQIVKSSETEVGRI
jgi:hypothetical protein